MRRFDWIAVSMLREEMGMHDVMYDGGVWAVVYTLGA